MAMHSSGRVLDDILKQLHGAHDVLVLRGERKGGRSGVGWAPNPTPLSRFPPGTRSLCQLPVYLIGWRGAGGQGGEVAGPRSPAGEAQPVFNPTPD